MCGGGVVLIGVGGFVFVCVVFVGGGVLEGVGFFGVGGVVVGVGMGVFGGVGGVGESECDVCE